MKEYKVKQNGRTILAIAPNGTVYAEYGGYVWAGDPITATLAGVGAIGSIIGGSKASSAAKSAAQTQTASADRAAELQNAMFQQAQGYTAPYRQAGYTAVPLLEYLATGNMPQMGQSELDEIKYLQGLSQPTTVAAIQPQQQPQPQTIDMQSQGAISDSDTSGYVYSPAAQTPQNAMGPAAPETTTQAGEGTPLTVEQQTRLNQLLGRQSAMKSAGGGLQSMIEQSPMYQYQSDIGNKQMNRMLSARGRGNSSFGINALGDYNRALIAGESENMYGRIANLANMGQGMAAQSGQNAMTTGMNVGNLMTQAGGATAQGQRQAGQQQASLYSNLGAMPMQAYGQYQLVNAMNQGGGSVNPYMSTQNPYGLTPGQGL